MPVQETLTTIPRIQNLMIPVPFILRNTTMLVFLSCLIDGLEGLRLEVEGRFTADIDVEKPTSSTGTSLEHFSHPLEDDIQNRSHSCLTLGSETHYQPHSLILSSTHPPNKVHPRGPLRQGHTKHQPAIFNLNVDTFILIFEHLDPPDQICLSLSCEPLYDLFHPLLYQRNGALAAFFDREGHGRAEYLVWLQGLRWLLCTVCLGLHQRDQSCQLPWGWKGRCVVRGSVKRYLPED
jgi:hypothetical protein